MTRQAVEFLVTSGRQSITELSSSSDESNCEAVHQGETQKNLGTKESVHPTSCLVQKINGFREFCGNFVNSHVVQSLVVFLIFVNAIMMGMATYGFVEDSEEISRTFELVDFVFLLVFTVELVLQFIANGVFDFLSDGWLCFDTIVIVASWSLNHFQIARAFRIVRAVRLTTRLEAFRCLLQALIMVGPSVWAISALLLLVMYIWACLCTELYADYYDKGITNDNYFGRLDFTMFTLFQLITLENWSDIVRQVGAESTLAWSVFSIFVIITAFMLYSLVIAVICDAVANTNEDEDNLSNDEAQKLILQYHRRIHLLELEQRQIQSLCRTCIMYAELTQKRYKLRTRPATQSHSWFSFPFSFRPSHGSNRSSMSEASQISRRSISRLDDSTASLSSSLEHGCRETPSGLTKFRNFCGAIINQPRVQASIVVMIAVNAFMMGLATYDFVTDSGDATRAFDVIDQCFLIIFTIEIGLQVIYHGIWHVLMDGWMCFDFVVVVGSWSLSNLQIIRSFRIFRALRLVSRLDTLKKLVQALIDVTPSVGGIISLLTLIVYIFAVMCTELFGNLYTDGVLDENYFGRLDYTLFTLFQFVTLSWAEITRQVADKYYWAWPMVTTFVILTSFILFSLVVAVVCDAVMQGERGDTVGKKEMRVRLRSLRHSFRKLTDRQDKLTMLVAKSCSHVGMASWADTHSKCIPPGRTPSYDASACSTTGSLYNEQWHGAFVDVSAASGNGDLFTNLELNILSKRRK